jgi:cob(I)alamin adenosyltransferase
MSKLIAHNKHFCLFLAGKGTSIGISRVSVRCLTASTVRCNLNTEDVATIEKRKKSNLYTKTGDAGSSSLYNGERRLKSEIVFDVLGHQDELNAVIGIAREHCALTNNGLDKMLMEIQSRLFDLGAAVGMNLILTPTMTL